MSDGSGRILGMQLVIFSMALSACATPKLYSNDIRVSYDGKQRAAAVQVSDIKLFPRHALINERREEQLYLEQQLADSASATFDADIVRDVEQIRTLSLALGLSFDASVKAEARATAERNDIAQQIAMENLRAKLAQAQRDIELLKIKLNEQATPSATATDAQSEALGRVEVSGSNTNKELAVELSKLVAELKSQLDKKSIDPRKSTGVGSPFDVFDDRQAYRKKIQAYLHANSLDALHDIGPNSLFRLQLQGTLLPEIHDSSPGDLETEAARRGRQFGLLEVTLKRPEISGADLQRELRPLYFRWLDYATSNLNQIDEDGEILTDAALFQLGLERRAMAIVVMNTGAKREGAKEKLALDLNRIIPYRRPATLPKIAAWAELKGAAVSDNKPHTEDKNCTVGPVPVDQAENQKHCVLFKIAYPPNFGTAEILQLQGAAEKIDVAALAMAVTQLETAGSCTGANDKLLPYADFLRNRHALRRLQRAYSWAHLKSGSDNASAAVEVSKLSNMVHDRLIWLDRAADSAQKQKCTTGAFAPGFLAQDVPDAFIEALFLKPAAANEPWRARGRVSVYAVTPAVMVQRVSTAARAADAIQMAASLAASLPTTGWGANAGLGYMRSVTGKVDALERVPLVIGFSSPAKFDSAGNARRETDAARFGWLLGPRVVMNSEKQALDLEYNPMPYDLAADVSVPGWWPQLVLESRGAWAPQWDIAKGRLLNDAMDKSSPQINFVLMRQTSADMEGVTSMLLDSTQNDGESGGAGLRLPAARVAKIEPVNVSDCAGLTTFVVRGNNLWRAQTAYLSGVEASKIAVMPDMGGVSITFDIAKLQPAAGDAKLIVPTPDGDGTGIIQVQGDRSIPVACGVKEPDDGSPKITSVLPEVIYACDRNQGVIVRGKYFTDLEEATLGNLNLAFRSRSADGKLMELVLAGPIGKSGGTQTKLPLVLRMKQGIAISNIPIERGNCSDDRSENGNLALVSGPIDVCVANTTPVVIGKDAKRISGARLVSNLPKFELRAKSVKYNPMTQTSEMEFVGVPKGAVSAPDQLASTIKLMLSFTKGGEVSVDAPLVCSAYGGK